MQVDKINFKKRWFLWVTFHRLWELTIENKEQTFVKPLIEKVMKTVNFKAFAQDKIQEKQLNFLKGGGNPVEELVHPPRK